MHLDHYKLWTAVVTPFNEDESVDYDSLTHLLKEQEEAKNGILILGSTGEALNIKKEDRYKIIEFTQNLDLGVPLMVGVPGSDLNETLDWLFFLETKKIQAYLMVTPHYAKPGELGQLNWFTKLMDKVTRPVMLYNVPSRTGIDLNLKALETLVNHKNFWAIKEASGSIDKFMAYKKICGPKPVYCGDDALLPDFSQKGSAGLVSVASNAWPKETHLYVDKCLSGTLDTDIWKEASNSLFLASNPVPVKKLLFLKKRIKNPITLLPLCSEDLKTDEGIINADRNIENWFKKEL